MSFDKDESKSALTQMLKNEVQPNSGLEPENAKPTQKEKEREEREKKKEVIVNEIRDTALQKCLKTQRPSVLKRWGLKKLYAEKTRLENADNNNKVVGKTLDDADQRATEPEEPEYGPQEGEDYEEYAERIQNPRPFPEIEQKKRQVFQSYGKILCKLQKGAYAGLEQRYNLPLVQSFQTIEEELQECYAELVEEYCPDLLCSANGKVDPLNKALFLNGFVVLSSIGTAYVKRKSEEERESSGEPQGFGISDAKRKEHHPHYSE